MSKKNCAFFGSVLLAFLLFSCASTKFEGNAVLTGRVYDMNGSPVRNYHISAGIGMDAITDASGSFVFKNASSGSYHIVGGGEGWCATEQDFLFFDRKSIICIQVEPLESVLPQIDALLREEAFQEAKSLLFKSKKYNERNPIFICYKNLIAYCASPTEKRKSALLSSIEKL